MPALTSSGRIGAARDQVVDLGVRAFFAHPVEKLGRLPGGSRLEQVLADELFGEGAAVHQQEVAAACSRSRLCRPVAVTVRPTSRKSILTTLRIDAMTVGGTN